MKRGKIVGSFVAVISVIAVVVFSHLSEHTGETDDAVSSDADGLGSEENEGRRGQASPKRRKDLRGLLSRIVQSQSDEELPTNVQASEDFDYQAMAKYTLIGKVVSPYFMEKAPETFDEILSEQQFNRSWTDLRERELRKQLEKERFKGNEIKDFACYETMCKLTMVHESEDVIETFASEAMMEGDVQGPTYGFRRPQEGEQEGAPIETSFYIGRYGDDVNIESALMDRLYENVTGQLASSVVPTDEQTQRVMAAYQQAWGEEDVN